MLAPGGHFAFTFQPSVHISRGFQMLEDRIIAESEFRRLYTSESFPPLPKSMPEVRFRVAVLQRSARDCILHQPEHLS